MSADVTHSLCLPFNGHIFITPILRTCSTKRQINKFQILRCRRSEKWLKEIREECVMEWTVRDFLSIPDEVDKLYLSPSFSFDGAQWCFQMYPNGQKKYKSEGYITVGVARQSSGPPIELNFSLSLKTSKNIIVGERHRTRNFDEGLDHFAWTYFLRRSKLVEVQSELAPSGHLTIVCRMKHPSSTDAARDSSTAGPVVKSKLNEDLKQLLQNQENCDVVLKVKGREFPAHKAILTARSSVFASAFRNDMKEKATGVVDIEDCDPSTFSDFLLFLYCEDVSGLSNGNVFSLFTAADKYDVSDLREKCLEFMKENLSVDTFCDFLTLVLRHSENELVRFATDFFVENADKIIVTVAWQTFAAENPTQSNELFIKFVSSVKH